MSLADSARLLAGSLVLSGRQRLELAALDVEEELLRAGTAIAAVLVATSLATLALAALAAAFVVALWNTAPVLALLGVALIFGGAAAFIGIKLAQALRTKPAFMAATLQELGRDAQALRGEAP